MIVKKTRLLSAHLSKRQITVVVQDEPDTKLFLTKTAVPEQVETIDFGNFNRQIEEGLNRANSDLQRQLNEVQQLRGVV